MQTAIELCKLIEPALRTIGLHCGVTGSRLYGNPKKNDIDVVIYGHNTHQGRTPIESGKLIAILTPILGEIRIMTESDYDEVLSCKFFDNRVDLILLGEVIIT